MWEQPKRTVRALWHWDLTGANTEGPAREGLYFGDQDTGTFAALDAPDMPPDWFNRDCCDGFDVAAEASRVVYTVCCFGGGGRSNRVFVRNAGMTGGSELNTYPGTGNVPGFNILNAITNYAAASYAMITTNGIFITPDITANPVSWTQLGAANTPAAACGIQAATANQTTTFFVKSNGCDGDRPGQLWRHVGTNAGGTWQQIQRNGNSQFGVFAVDPTNPQRLFAADLFVMGTPAMVFSADGGTTWQTMPQLDMLMTGNGAFAYTNQRGPRRFTSLAGYVQPSLVAIDSEDGNILIAGAADAGVFMSFDGGATWAAVTGPMARDRQHIPRPHHAFFDHEPQGRVCAYIGTTGRGAWRICNDIPGTMATIVVPVGWQFDYVDSDHHINEHSLRVIDESLDASTTPPIQNWTSAVEFKDKNSDDDYKWDATFQILRLSNAFATSGETDWLNKNGNTSTHDGTVTLPELAGFDTAFVVLKGWGFDYTDPDHHINDIGIRLVNLRYDSASGTITWRAEAQYADKNFDDDYRWRYQWQVMATNAGVFSAAEQSGNDGGGTDLDSGSVTDSQFASFDSAVVIPTGWRFNYADSDHHINENSLRIRNVQFDASTGSVRWNAVLNYADKNFDDGYDWRYNVVVLVFKSGAAALFDVGPFEDDGGSDSESFATQVPQ